MLACIVWILSFGPFPVPRWQERHAGPSGADPGAPVEEGAPGVELPGELRTALDEVVALRGAGDAEGARARLKAIVDGSRYPTLLGEDDPVVLAALAEVHSIAESLSAVDVQATVAGERVHRLEGRLPADHPDILRARLDLAVARRLLGDLQGALELEEHVHAIFVRELPPDDPDLLRAELNLAVTRQTSGDFEGARELLEHVHAVRERDLPPDDPGLLRAKLNLGMTRRTLGDLRGALELEEHVHSIWDEQLAPEHPDLLRIKLNLAVTRQTLGDVAGAAELFEHVLAMRERLLPADHPDLLATKLNLAWSRWARGDLEGASRLMEYVHGTWEKQLPPDNLGLLSAKINLAVTRRALGDIEGALELVEYVHAAQERLFQPDHPDLLRTKLNLASVRRELGDVEGALELVEHVHRTWEASFPPDHPSVLSAKQTLASVLYDMGQFERALELDEQVLAAREKVSPEDDLGLVRAQANVAILRYALGDFEGAHELLEHAHAVCERILPADHPDLIGIKRNLAVARQGLGDLAGARELEEQVLVAWERLLPSGHPELLGAKVNLALKRRALGDVEGGLELAESILGGVQARAAWMHVQAPRFARSASRTLMPRLEGALLASRQGGFSAGARARLFSAFESLRLVSTDSSEIALAADRDPGLRDLCEHVARVRRELGELGASPPASPAELEAWRQHLLELGEDRDALQRELRTRLAESGVELAAPTVEAVARALPHGQIFVSLFSYRRYFDLDLQTGADPPNVRSVLAFVVTPEADVRLVELGPSEELERLARDWRDALGAPVRSAAGDLQGLRGEPIQAADGAGEERALAIGRELRQRLLDPCLDPGDDPPIGVHLVLDDFLHLVPVDALPWVDERCTGEVFDLLIESSTRRLLRAARPVGRGGTLVALGGVDFDAPRAEDDAAVSATGGAAAVAGGPAAREGVPGYFGPLAETRGEIEAVARLFREFVGEEPVVLSRGEATKSALHGLAANARILHIATHGWFAEETFASEMDVLEESGPGPFSDADRVVRGYAPESLCGLALAGANLGASERERSPGILTAEELATLDLTGCELAVLSACETNVGIRRAGQGIQSLQSALHAAGARTAITSLWRVDDAATRRFMELFYTGLWEDGLGKADALWRAKMALRDEGNPMRDWAGWVLTGDPE